MNETNNANGGSNDRPAKTFAPEGMVYPHCCSPMVLRVSRNGPTPGKHFIGLARHRAAGQGQTGMTVSNGPQRLIDWGNDIGPAKHRTGRHS